MPIGLGVALTVFGSGVHDISKVAPQAGEDGHALCVGSDEDIDARVVMLIILIDRAHAVHRRLHLNQHICSTFYTQGTLEKGET
jgi:hypothetical protein